MGDALKKRLEFPSPLIQAQAVRSLVSSILKENDQNEKIGESTTQSLALVTLWEQCSSESMVVRSACCDALVLLVEQGYADLQYVLNSILNLLPSARNVQGLIKVVGRLLQIQASQRDKNAPFNCPYSIRSCPHPYITVLENRPDCWPALLQEIDDFIQLAAEKDEPLYISMLAPFLRYLYCEPQGIVENALLRHSLLKVLLQPHAAVQSLSSRCKEEVLHCLVHLFSHVQVDSITAVVELSSMAELLSCTFLKEPELWKTELAQLALQVLCASHISLQLGGELRSLLHTLHQLLPVCKKDLPSDQVIMGISLLLLRASASQQTALLELAVKIIPPDECPPSSSKLLVMPLLQVLSCSVLMEALTDLQTRTKNQKLANSLLQTIQREPCDPLQSTTQLMLPLSTWYSKLQVATAVSQKVCSDAATSMEWLYSVQSALHLDERVSDAVVLLVAYLILTSEGHLCMLALDTAAGVCEADPTQVPCLLPVLMFKLSRVSDLVLSRALLFTLPKLGTHQFCIPQLLHVLQMLASCPKLRPMSLRLLSALWKKQDRVYADLQKLLTVMDKSSVVIGKEVQWEQIIARAACVRDICMERPYHHGGDMLAGIADILNQCSRRDQATPAALALQGLQGLCKAEVVDIASTWKALFPKLGCETRPMVLKAIAELLSLVPSLHVKTEQYENFKSEVVIILWNYALSQDVNVAASGYRALSEFPESSHSILHLPEPARPEVKQPCDEQEEEEKKEDIFVPGSSYIKLIGLTQEPALPALECFFTSLIRQEMSQMPRGVYHLALREGLLRSDQGKTVAGVPAFLLKTYEKNKQPGLKPGLAASLLLCYDLPIQTDKDGRPINRFIVSRGRSYQQMLTTLIHEVNIQPSDWHRSLLLPQAWRGFMNRAYHAVLQGRKAELEMLQRQGKENPVELQYKQYCAWLWVRDQLTAVVKNAAKDSPVVQGNCILALSGLAVALSRHESSLPGQSDDQVEVGPEILTTAHWLSMVIDTLLSIANSSSRPKAQVFSWFVHRSYSGENTASAIARSCATLGLAMMVPVLANSYRDTVPIILATLKAGLPGASTANDSQAVQFHSSLALGMLLTWLNEERISDIGGQSMQELLLDYLGFLKELCFNTQLEHNAGCVLAVGLLLCSVSGSSDIEQRACVSVSLDQLFQCLADSSILGRMQQEVLAYSVACAGVSAFSCGIIDAMKANEIMNTLRSITEENQQTPGLSLALGLAVHGLSSSGLGTAEDLHPRLLSAWTKILLAEGCPTMQRLAALNGVIALVGSETAFLKLKSKSEQSPQQQSRLNDVIRSIIQIISFSGAIGLQSNGVCLLAHLHLANMSSSYSRMAVPQDYSYLTEKSIIRASLSYVIDAGRKGPSMISADLLKVVLAPLATVGASFQYPPVNWSAVLTPLMRLQFGEEIEHQSLHLAANQSQSSTSASLFLGVWLAPPLVHGLSLCTRAFLYECLCLWMKHVAEDKLQVYVESLAVEHFNPANRTRHLSLCVSILKGLAKAMALPNPAQKCWTILCSTTEKIFHLLPDHIPASEVDLYEGICCCLSEMTDTEIDRMVKVTETNVEKTAFILSYLSSKGRIPLLALNDVIGTVLQGGTSDKIGWLLLQCFYQSRLASNPNTGVSKRMEWLLELMGHIRKVAYGTPSVKCENTKRSTRFLLDVFAAAVVSWADHSMPLLIGVRAHWFPWHKSSSKPSELSHDLYVNPLTTEESVKQCLLAMPYSLKHLLDKEPWKSQSQKFIDWFFSLTEAPDEALAHTARAALLALKSNPEFKKKAVWTRAYGW